MVVRAASSEWLCWLASWMACSSVMLLFTCPLAVKATSAAPRARLNDGNGLSFKAHLRFRKNIAFPRNPSVKRGQQNDAQQQIGNQAAHDDDREGPLRIRSDVVRHSGRQQS